MTEDTLTVLMRITTTRSAMLTIDEQHYASFKHRRGAAAGIRDDLHTAGIPWNHYDDLRTFIDAPLINTDIEAS